MAENVLPMFSCKSVIVSRVTFRCLIHFELIFVYGVLSPSSSLLADSHIQLIKDIKFILFNIQELYKQVLNLGLILT